MMNLNSTLKTARYQREIPNYPIYRKSAGRTNYNNGGAVLAKKMIIQSVICILIVFVIAWLQNNTEEISEKIISQIRFQLVEQHVSADEIYQTLEKTYDDCVQYIQGTNE